MRGNDLKCTLVKSSRLKSSYYSLHSYIGIMIRQGIIVRRARHRKTTAGCSVSTLSAHRNPVFVPGVLEMVPRVPGLPWECYQSRHLDPWPENGGFFVMEKTVRRIFPCGALFQNKSARSFRFRTQKYFNIIHIKISS